MKIQDTTACVITVCILADIASQCLMSLDVMFIPDFHPSVFVSFFYLAVIQLLREKIDGSNENLNIYRFSNYEILEGVMFLLTVSR